MHTQSNYSMIIFTMKNISRYVNKKKKNVIYLIFKYKSVDYFKINVSKTFVKV